MTESKRDQLVQRALMVFYEGGFHAVGMDRLAKETGVSKTAIYKHFRTKDDLILATLRLRDENFRNWMMRGIEEQADTPKERLLSIFVVLGQWFAEPNFRSCMFIKASSEYQDRDHPVHTISAEHKRLVQRYFESLAQEAGATNPAELADQLLLLKEGAIVLAHLLDPQKAAIDAGAAAKILIERAIA